jgi:hypothetical protein
MIRTLVFTICPVATLRAVGFKGAALSQFLGHQHTAMHCFIILIKSWVKYNGYVCSIYELKRNCVYTKTSLPLKIAPILSDFFMRFWSRNCYLELFEDGWQIRISLTVYYSVVSNDRASYMWESAIVGRVKRFRIFSPIHSSQSKNKTGSTKSNQVSPKPTYFNQIHSCQSKIN